MRFLLVGCLVGSAMACVHTPPGGLEALKPTLETFHQRIRWRDFRGAAELVSPERRDAFLKLSRERNDDRDLTVTDYQLEDARVSTDGLRAEAVSRVSWTRLPSVSERTEEVTSELAFRQGAWLIELQRGGPFADAFER